MRERAGPVRSTFRSASPADAHAIAALHAASWRAHYRGSLSDAYLDGPIEAERQAVWTQRLGHPRDGQVVLLAEDEAGSLIGFVCAFLDNDETYGSLIDNLHVSVDAKRRGLGRQLMHQAGQAMLHALPRCSVYLYVLEANHAARRFYERVGGSMVERGRKTEPDGSEVSVLRFAWDTPAALVASTSMT